MLLPCGYCTCWLLQYEEAGCVKMSSLMLLLTLSVAGFPPLDSFLVSPRAGNPARSASPRLFQRHALEKSGWSTAKNNGNLKRQWRPRRSTDHEPTLMKPNAHFTPRGAPGPALTSSSSSEATDTDNDNSNANSSPRNAPRRIRRTKRSPREHVPVTGAEEVSAGGAVADDQLRVIDGSWEGAGPFVGGEGRPTPTSPFGEPSYDERIKFMRIMEDVLGTEREEELLSKLTKHIEFLLSVDITRLTNDMIRKEPTMDRIRTLHNAYDFVVTFLEGMVENTLEVQKKNRKLLRDIIEVAKIGPEKFEAKMSSLEDRFNYDFVQYLDAEITRLEKGDTSPGSGGGREVINVVKLVRTRVCAQLDLMLGEDVAVLTRLLSYDDRYMMRAALRAVFQDRHEVQIDEFAKLVSNTLEDVNKMKGADPLLRYKLVDMADDVDLLAREWKKTKEEIAREKAEEAEQKK